MHEQDKKEFGFDIRDLNWDQYIKDYCMGTKQYLFNEDLTNIPIARRQIKRWAPVRTSTSGTWRQIAHLALAHGGSLVL